MSDQPIPGKSFRSPSAMLRLREKQAELDAKVLAGEMTAEAAGDELHAFRGMMFAHVREHGADRK